jgi:hypothetical protein
MTARYYRLYRCPVCAFSCLSAEEFQDHRSKQRAQCLPFRVPRSVKPISLLAVDERQGSAVSKGSAGSQPAVGPQEGTAASGCFEIHQRTPDNSSMQMTEVRPKAGSWTT